MKNIQTTVTTKILPSPMGPLEVTFTDKGLCALRLQKENHLQKSTSSDTERSPGFLKDFKLWLTDYFLAKDVRPNPEWIDWSLFTETQKNIYGSLLKTQAGQTLTYKDLAERSHVNNGSRVTGTAMSKNPLPILIPCHRVIPTNSSELGAYSFHEGYSTKARLLNLENSSLTQDFKPYWEFDWKRATDHLEKTHQGFDSLAKHSELLRSRIQKSGSTFETLVRAILSQQVHPKAAATMKERLYKTFLEKGTLNLSRIARMGQEDQKQSSLSPQKARAIKELAQHGLDGKIPEYPDLLFLSDQEITLKLTEFRGIGEWTTQMLMIFSLGRPNIWPINDLGVQYGTQRLLRARARVSPKRLEKVGRPFAPFRTVASLYLWNLHSTGSASSPKPKKKAK